MVFCAEEHLFDRCGIVSAGHVPFRFHRRTQNRNVTGRSHEAGGILSQHLPWPQQHTTGSGNGWRARRPLFHARAAVARVRSVLPASQLSGFTSVQEKSEARWMYERLLTSYKVTRKIKQKIFIELCCTGSIKDAITIPDPVAAVSAF